MERFGAARQSGDCPTIRNGHFSECIVSICPSVRARAGIYSPCRTFLTRRVQLTKWLRWTRPDGSHYTVPAGFASDGPSFPMWSSPLLPDRIEALEAGILHDCLCRDPSMPNSWADGEFRQALKALGIHPFYAWLCYMGLRIASPWRNNDQWSWRNFLSWVVGGGEAS